MRNPSHLLALTFFSFTCTAACSSTPATSDAGTDAPATGVLGFAPSNLGSALDAVDITKLVDIDVTNASALSVECGIRADGRCFTTTITQSDGTQVIVYFAKSWRVEPNASLAPGVDKPIIVVALGTIDVLGKIEMSAEGNTAVGGGFSGFAAAGGGKGGGAAGSDIVNAPGVGGGGGAFCGGGGAGGNASGATGAGGPSYGTATLVPLAVGSAGGGGATIGGGSGGAIELVAGQSITIESQGVIAAGGGGGFSGNGNGTGQAGSGGGSGGGILLEAPSVTVAGTVSVNGGGGGGGSGSPDSQYGKDATENAQAAAGGNPTTTGAGGTGGAGATSSGAAGAIGDLSGAGTNAAGGGGGGAGYIRINTKSGAATISGTLSPATGTTCTTQGTLGGA
ncbi:MAG TPA: hypothetical protein VH054_15225 [Polyangiaceae bacterium]|nr:hypothetical protein [Polyangiaceae bacterium]